MRGKGFIESARFVKENLLKNTGLISIFVMDVQLINLVWGIHTNAVYRKLCCK